jgi:hypothetical protein
VSDKKTDRKLNGKAKGFAMGCLTQYSLYREAEDIYSARNDCRDYIDYLQQATT